MARPYFPPFVARTGRLPRPIGPGGGGEKNSRFYTKDDIIIIIIIIIIVRVDLRKKMKVSERLDKTRFLYMKKNILIMARPYFPPFVGRNLRRKVLNVGTRWGGRGGGMARLIRKQVFLTSPKQSFLFVTLGTHL